MIDQILATIDASIASNESTIRALADQLNATYGRYSFPRTHSDEAMPKDGIASNPDELNKQYPYQEKKGTPTLEQAGVGQPPYTDAFTLASGQGFEYPHGYFINYSLDVTVQNADDQAWASERGKEAELGESLRVYRTVDYGQGHFNQAWSIAMELMAHELNN